MASLILIGAWLLILTGLVGIVLPVLPGIGLIYAGIFLYAWYFGWGTIGIPTLIALGAVAALSTVIDYVASAYGARHYGASKYGSWGAILGGFLGFIIFNVFGLLAGVFIGAVLGETLFAEKNMEASLKAGYGSLLGFLAGTVLKFLLGLIMIGVFVWKILAT